MQAGRNRLPAFRRGFTFIELLAVLALLAILTALAVPSYQASIKRAKRAEAWAAMMKIMQQQERHYSMQGSYATYSASKPQGFAWHSGNTPQSSAYEISAAACEGYTLKQCVVLTAKPGTQRVQAGYTDKECGTLALDSTGTRTTSGDGTFCW
jgi:type IV pilus assembly protein PilE